METIGTNEASYFEVILPNNILGTRNEDLRFNR
jgi:hypothetical protein